MNTDLRKKAKKWFWKIIKLTNKAAFGETMENMREQIDIIFVKIEKRRNYLMSEPNYYTAKNFTQNLLAIELKKRRYLWINQTTQVYQY